MTGDHSDAGPQMRRWTEQRWLLDNLIRANGIEWDQPRLGNLTGALGPEAGADIAAVRSRVQKYADIAPAFEAVARRREAKAKEAEAAGTPVIARENYYMAASFWASAQWPLDENSPRNLAYNKSKRDCFEKYASLADHRVEAAWIPFQGKALPGWFHLPPNYAGGKIPVVVAIPGMDGFKERGVSLYGDRWLNRGVAVLVVEGPGQYESPTLGIYVTVEGWAEAGTAIFNWLAARPEIDPARVGITGNSFGSLFATIAASHEPRYKACAVASTCLEPGCRTIFEEASPTFKKRFMYMSNYIDEAKFDSFAKSLTWEGHIDTLKMPYLCVAGEADELSPLELTDRLMTTLKAPRQLVIYQDSRHSVGNVPATNLGPHPQSLISEWMLARFAGKPLANERWFVDAAGRVNKTSLDSFKQGL